MSPLIPFPRLRRRGIEEIQRVVSMLERKRALSPGDWLEIRARLRPLLRGTRESHALKALFFPQLVPWEPDQ